MFISQAILSPCVNDVYLKRFSGKIQLVHNFPHRAVARVFIIAKHTHQKVNTHLINSPQAHCLAFNVSSAII